MQVFYARDIPQETADPATFTGDALVKRLAFTEGARAVKVFRVQFEPAARTNWHTHSGVQILLIVEGQGRVERWGEPVFEVGPGDAVCIAPEEKHWHGAAPSLSMVHLAVNVDVTTVWMEPVSDDEYAAIPPP